jgi:hypothetical protein
VTALRRSAAEFLISADPKQHAGPRLYFTKGKFSDHGKPARFATLTAAREAAQYLLANFATLHKYRVRVEGVSADRHTVGVWHMNPLQGKGDSKSATARANPIGFLTLLQGGSAVKTLSSSNSSRRKNPSKRDEIDKAARLLKDFSGHRPGEILKVRHNPIKRGLVIGTLDGVPYTTIRDGKSEHYLHEFAKDARPLLIASSDGRRLGIVGGRFQFTEAGIIDT